MTITVDIQINYLAVLAAAVSAMVVGSLWYGMVFKKQWVALMGWSEEKVQQMQSQGANKMYAIQGLMALIMAYVLAHFVAVWNVTDVSGALALTFWVWLGFIVTTMIQSVLWEGKSMKLYFLNIANQFVTIFVMAIILTMWR